MASGLSPLDGILVPTFGAFYLAVTLLFPFVAIRVLGREKETAALSLLVQLPYRAATLIAAKMAAIAIAWLVALIPALSTLALWEANRRASLCPGDDQPDRGASALRFADWGNCAVLRRHLR